MAEYSLEPVAVPPVNTKYRTIKTKIPVPESVPILESLLKSEPRSMLGQPPVIWHSAEGFTIGDRWGNRWIDWSSCVLVANVGHGRPEIKEALRQVIDQGLLSTYVFVHERRAELAKMLTALAPDPGNYRVFLLSTGSEAIENCIKLAKTYGLKQHGPAKKYIVSFGNAFHGRTMGAQLAGGMEHQKTWMVDRDPSFIQVPFPDGFETENTSFDLFLEALAARKVTGPEIAGVIAESYQGVGPFFMPIEYAQKLAGFCRQHDIVLCMDEVQAGFGRTGEMFCYEHYGITPDLVACGKGISSSLPISAVIGRADIMDLYPPGSMTSTHSASPLPVAAAIANLKVLMRDNLVANSAAMGEVLIPGLRQIRERHANRLSPVFGKGLVAGILVVKPGTKEPDPAAALAINVSCMQQGLLMFSPVGTGGHCLKIAPPLSITEEALRESLQVFGQAVNEVLADSH